MYSYDLYSDYQNLEDIEATFNIMLLYLFLKPVAKMFNEERTSGAIFKAGEAPLQAMKKQINDPDDSSIYYADGIIKFYNIKQLQALLLEISSSLGSSDKTKSLFVHHKGLFGLLAMAKTVADEFYLASVNTFSKLKLFFVHAIGRNIYLWSMRFVEEGPVYELWLEKDHTIKTSFEEKDEQLPEAVGFFWAMKCLLQ